MSNDLQPVIFGEVLYDCFPDGSQVLGGAPFNVAWNCQAFGLSPVFISRIGNDELGTSITQAMNDWGMSTQGVQVDNEHATGMVKVSFHGQEPYYDIVKNSAWDYISSQETAYLNETRIIYHGSLALRNEDSANSLFHLTSQHTSPVFVDVNLRPPWWDHESIDRILTDCRWLKINLDELVQVVRVDGDMLKKARHLISHYKIEYIVVTLGDKGAVIVSQDNILDIAPQNKVEVVDTVGAGDAFSSVILLGLCKNWDLTQTVERAQQFASAVVQMRGATTMNRSFYDAFINQWQL